MLKIKSENHTQITFQNGYELDKNAHNNKNTRGKVENQEVEEEEEEADEFSHGGKHAKRFPRVFFN